MIKVIMERYCKPGKEQSLEGLLKDLRSKAMHQPGYLTGETLVEIDNPASYLTIGTWTRLEHWKAWQNNQERLEVVNIIAPLLTDEAKVRVYGPPLEDA